MPNYRPDLQKIYHELEVNDTWTKEAVTDIFDKMNEEPAETLKKPEQESKADYVLRHLKAGDKLSVCNMPYFTTSHQSCLWWMKKETQTCLLWIA